MQKARRHTFTDAPTACRHMVSGSVSLLSSRSFSPFPHGTGPLSVSGKYLALADGPAGFTQDFSCPALLRIPAERFRRFVYGIVTLCDPPFQVGSTSTIAPFMAGPSTPSLPKQKRFGLLPFRSPLLGESLLCFLFLRVLRCFSSPRSPPPSSGGWYDLLIPGCPIRISADPFVFADPRSFSQLVTSFIAFQSLGILHVPFVTFFSSPLSGVLPTCRGETFLPD